MLGHALQQHPTLEEINFKFFEAGHSYMECDTMHSTIECAGRRKEINVPNDWKNIVRHAIKSTRKEQYSVHSMNFNDFGNYKELKDMV